MSVNDARQGLYGEYLLWIACRELALGKVCADLWGGAITESMGDENAARCIYLARRADALREEPGVMRGFLALLHPGGDDAAQGRDARVLPLARRARGRAAAPEQLAVDSVVAVIPARFPA